MIPRGEARSRWVMVGAGNAHLKFLMMRALRPLRGLELVLVNRVSTIFYSAMLPRYWSGEIPLSALEIDLPALCAAQGIRFVLGEVKGLDRAARRLTIEGRESLAYDTLSLALGAEPSHLEAFASHPGLVPVKPLERLVPALDRRLGKMSAEQGTRLAIVGGGASGCELALALRRRFASEGKLSATLFQAEAEILPAYPPAASARMLRALSRAGVEVRCGVRVEGADGDKLRIAGGAPETFAAVVLATSEGVPKIVSALGLPVDRSGHIVVDEDLRVKGEKAIFATGDCVVFPRLPAVVRNGVYAVRQGEQLYRSVVALSLGREPGKYRPARRFLSLLNVSDRSAILTYGNTVLSGRWARRFKDAIDERWIGSFRRMARMGPGAVSMDEMLCGGCGSKVSSRVLTAAIAPLPDLADPRILVGRNRAEDAAVHQPPPGQVEIQSVDFFPAFVDDPRLFGRLTAQHALSDIYAMNGTPFSALAICTVPTDSPERQQEVLAALLRGALDTLHPLGVNLTGGHTTQGEKLALGFAVTGYGTQTALFHKRALKAGDRLILVKPIGSGALLASLMRERGRADWFAGLFASLEQANATAARIFSQAGAKACTDITGFGLGGHLIEMLEGTPYQAVLHAAEVPVFEGFEATVRGGIQSTLAPANRQAILARLSGAKPEPWLFDPQTCGGLLGGISAPLAEQAVRELREAGYERARIIAEILPADEKSAGTIVIR